MWGLETFSLNIMVISPSSEIIGELYFLFSAPFLILIFLPYTCISYIQEEMESCEEHAKEECPC